MQKSKIEWCTHTLNAAVGCPPPLASPGCRNCYARAMSRRFDGGRFDEIRYFPERLDVLTPRRPLKSKMLIFHGSMCDPFHDKFGKAFTRKWLYAAMNAPVEMTRHVFLTKRPQNIKERLPEWWGDGPPNIMLGISASTQGDLEQRWCAFSNAGIPGKKLISIEPMLEPVFLDGHSCQNCAAGAAARTRPMGQQAIGCSIDADWVICGAETGPGKRPMDPAWAIRLRDECRGLGIPFFFKKNSNGFPLLDGELAREYPKGWNPEDGGMRV